PLHPTQTLALSSPPRAVTPHHALLPAARRRPTPRSPPRRAAGLGLEVEVVVSPPRQSDPTTPLVCCAGIMAMRLGSLVRTSWRLPPPRTPGGADALAGAGGGEDTGVEGELQGHSNLTVSTKMYAHHERI
ncbi:unnamed protein product, partial [Urochloa humidicola]